MLSARVLTATLTKLTIRRLPMPVTRSASTSASAKKRKSPPAESPKSPTKRVRKSKSVPAVKSDPTPVTTVPVNFVIPQPNPDEASADPMLPAVLSFSFGDAKKHLIAADSRFEELFTKLPCKPYEILEVIHPFSSLCDSILGQQISWLAARSVRHKFIRLYKPDLPEKVADYNESKKNFFYPTPGQVANTDTPALRSAGLSGRKAEYIKDLASKFVSGDLSPKKLLEASDEDLAEMLIAVRGIGRWTVDMFAIFSLRRPNILPVGDLGVQRGVIRWFLALHSSAHPYSLSPHKLPAQSKDEAEKKDKKDEDALPSTNGANDENGAEPGAAAASGSSSVLSAETSTVTGTPMSALPSKPPALTPSIAKTLEMEKAKEKAAPLPAGLTVAELKNRLAGKKKIKGAMLTPEEMEALTEPWKPYRSIGVYFMWALAEGEK